MGVMFRIFDRFKVTGIGNVYMLKTDKGSIVQVGESLYDFHGNEFRISGIETFTRCWEHMPPIDEMPVVVAVELMNGVEPQGDLLFKELPNVNIR